MTIISNVMKYFQIFCWFYCFFSTVSSVAQSLYVGQSTSLVCPDAPIGAVYQTAWGSRHQCVSVQKMGTYSAKVTVNSFFSGVAQVQCDYYWAWYSGSVQHTNHATTYFNITCKPVDIRLNQTGPIDLFSGSGVPLSVTLSPNITPEPTVFWRTSNSNIVEIGQNGYATAKAPGSATISVSSNAGPNTASIQINVSAIPVQSVSISPENLYITSDESRKIGVSLYPQYSQANSIQWFSDNPSIASVNSNGIVFGKSIGQCRVHCVVNNVVVSNYVNVTVSKPRLSLSASLPDGLYEQNSIVSLSCSKPDATIYYTIDGTEPSYKSAIYNEPIVLKNSTVLKAFATRHDCIDSDVLVKNYRISSLKVKSTYPVEGQEIFRKNIVPSITFNNNISLLNNARTVKLKKADGSIVNGEVVVTENVLSFIPEENLNRGEYNLYVPSQVLTSNNDEENFSFTLAFKVVGDNRIKDFSCGNQYTLLVNQDNELWAWGRNDSGQLGNGKTLFVTYPVKIMDNVNSVEASVACSAAIDNDGNLYMWGANDYGQLGNESTKDRNVPTYIMSNVVKVVTSGDNTFAITSGGYLYSWGGNWWGQLGVGEKNQYKWSPRYVMKNIKEVAASYSHTLILTNDNDLYTCGCGSNGQLGNGQYVSYICTPCKVMSDVKKIAATRNASIVLKQDGTLWTFGDNAYGQLGIGNDGASSLTPVKVLDNVKDIDAQGLVAMAIKTDNSLWGWGSNRNKNVADNTQSIVWSPIKVMDDVESVSIGDNFVQAFSMDGNLYGWGDNYCYQTLPDYSGTLSTPIVCPHFHSLISPISLSFSDITLKIGETGVIIPNIEPYDASYSGIEWSSSNPNIVSISDFGKIKAIKVGKSRITCRIWLNDYSIVENSCDVDVRLSLQPDSEVNTIYSGLIGDGADWIIENDLLPEDLTYVWMWDSNYNCMKASAYKGANHVTSATVTSPVIDLTGYKDVTLSFEHIGNFFKGNMQNDTKVLISVDGGEFTELAVAPWPEVDAWKPWIEAKADLRMYDGRKIQVRFLYTSNESRSGTWEVKKFIVKGTKTSEGVTDVEIVDENAQAVYYNLQGVRIDNPEKGLYIKVQGKKSSKVYIK